jgi:c(7)-type cytochrome triheme protein
MKIRFPRITFWGVVLCILWAMGLYATFVRFFYGLGAATHLSDAFPWGVWIGFDILVGVGLAAGGFVITATVYIFNLKDFKPIARPTVLTAFLGYLLVVAALMFDLGKPYNVWHPIIMWNPHSVMFEVGWCVMLYTTVLFLEFSPLVLERFGFKKPLLIMAKLTPFFVMAGVLLSTLHQSSLGTLYVIVPDKLHPLWYSGILPIFFFISAIAAGLAMVIFESYLSSRAFAKELEFSLLMRLSRVIVLVLGLLLIVRFQDMMGRGAVPLIWDGSRESIYFIIEISLGIFLPMLMFSVAKIRENRAGLFLGAVFVLLGFVMNRLNVAITGMTRSSGVDYTPSWMEWVITASIVAAGIVIFRLAAKYLPVFGSHKEQTPPAPPPLVAAGKSGSIAVAILGGLLLITLIAIGYGFSQKKNDVAAMIEPAQLQAAESKLRLPGPIAFEKSADSPGVVTFNHETHVDPSRPNCKSCHSALFSIKPEQAGRLGTVKMEALYEQKQCGVCHNGEKAFKTEEGCENCHQSH